MENALQEREASTARSVLARPANPAPRVGATPWVEITLCLIVAGLLLMVVAVPRSHSSLESAGAHGGAPELREALDELRAAIGAYHLDHGAWPGQALARKVLPGGDARSLLRLEQQLMLNTDASGEPSWQKDGVHLLGPYLECGLPANPINDLSTVRFLDEGEPWPADPDGMTGWMYRPATGEIRANSTGLDPGGGRYFDL